eukprot:UN22422
MKHPKILDVNEKARDTHKHCSMSQRKKKAILPHGIDPRRNMESLDTDALSFSQPNLASSNQRFKPKIQLKRKVVYQVGISRRNRGYSTFIDIHGITFLIPFFFNKNLIDIFHIQNSTHPKIF